MDVISIATVVMVVIMIVGPVIAYVLRGIHVQISENKIDMADRQKVAEHHRDQIYVQLTTKLDRQEFNNFEIRHNRSFDKTDEKIDRILDNLIKK